MKNTITLVSGGRSMTADTYTPHGASHGLVVIAYGSDGMTNNLSGPWRTMIEGYAVSLVAKGFSVLIPDYLSTSGTPPGPAVFDAIGRSRETWLRGLSDATDQFIALSKADPKRVGLLGFSLGGHLVLRLRRKARVLVEFFAPVLDGLGSPGALAHAQIHHGEADKTPGTGIENASLIKATLNRENTPTELYAYPGASHGFIGADQANKTARELSKARTLSFFGDHLPENRRV
ncbi:dienelactone hydrolase family protein [Variovorax rhizosphaerae]|uniref:Alpha/beta fold hydrolase n=1 Tax=Variovorax rhizosphaerae TaxID=1836200 RepID=A0ABU8WPP5_9BURK